MAHPIISFLKKKINKEKIVLIDSPPGINCPVIHSIMNVDFCVLVTEPTPFGLYNLKMILELVKKLKIPHGVIVNRDGIGNKEVEEFCERENIPILMKIPESKKIAELCSVGIPFTQELLSWREKFEKLYEDVKNSCKNFQRNSNLELRFT